MASEDLLNVNWMFYGHFHVNLSDNAAVSIVGNIRDVQTEISFEISPEVPR